MTRTAPADPSSLRRAAVARRVVLARRVAVARRTALSRRGRQLGITRYAG